ANWSIAETGVAFPASSLATNSDPSFGTSENVTEVVRWWGGPCSGRTVVLVVKGSLPLSLPTRVTVAVLCTGRSQETCTSPFSCTEVDRSPGPPANRKSAVAGLLSLPSGPIATSCNVPARWVKSLTYSRLL